ncbi:MAG: pyridoxal-dependent decarboxylase [Coleofasciculus chthonoplastes F3-SA18-01]|uniref:pyridoxal phosphate-dependent decarboxylase family protein n=1 Tax=Coleofasciculus chthonoplastes TaxID=64178 RepID=UPI0032F59065
MAATSGTTVLGAFDPIDKIAGITAKYNLWLHVDAAYGGSFILSDRGKSWFGGCELADSFAWDAHKLMGIPLPCSVILTKNQGVLYEGCTTCDVSKASSYIFHDYDEAAYDLGKKSLQCTRKVDVVKLWLAWKYYGDRGYSQRMDRLLELAEYTEERIRAFSHSQ